LRTVTASQTLGGTLSVRARPATCRPELLSSMGAWLSTIVFEEGRTPRGASRSTATPAGGPLCRLGTTLASRHNESWPCKSNPVRLGSCVSRALARREIAGFRPGFWPQGQLRHPSSLGDLRQGAGLAAGRHPEPQGRTGVVGLHQRHRRLRHARRSSRAYAQDAEFATVRTKANRGGRAREPAPRRVLDRAKEVESSTRFSEPQPIEHDLERHSSAGLGLSEPAGLQGRPVAQGRSVLVAG
jgi:hypothetical protein